MRLRRPARLSAVSRRPATVAWEPAIGTRPSACPSRPPTVSTSSTSISTPNSSARSSTDSRAVTRAEPSASRSTGGVSWSYSSVISPTISSRMSSIVTRPAVPPYSSMTIAQWMRRACISRSSSSIGLLSGTYDAGRMIDSIFSTDSPAR